MDCIHKKYDANGDCCMISKILGVIEHCTCESAGQCDFYEPNPKKEANDGLSK